MPKTHNVYVIELSAAVLQKKGFMRANPGYVAGKPCVYVGMTGRDVDTRFDQHKAGIKANKYAQHYGLRLLPELFEHLNPMTYEDARYIEVDVGIRLREKGYGVWQA